MNELNFCPKCGHETLIWDQEKKWSCSQCNFVLYHNVAGAVAVLITIKDEILFTRRNQDPKKGKLDLAGGFVDPKESAEETCVRELFEEMKIKMDLSKLKYLAALPNTYEYKNILYNTGHGNTALHFAKILSKLRKLHKNCQNIKNVDTWSFLRNWGYILPYIL